ncbi:hypothetical protein [Denitrobaculum tricleocarpae]|uniref:Uncharacterized protein n=1 Tax=Denitrobaculum tricleocarpae TaxID=2591009 RepID=A0A545TXY3_9PROT|nr:hypothetical protein [Denitrobaculum tricleocarpae]TQV82054.1 hypothetical protein FKG95_07415 [Denitrobaculum tricleocarpae]
MTQTIAMIAGPYLLVTGLGFLLSADFYQRMIASSTNAEPMLVNLSGAAHFVVGLVILVQHFQWSSAPEIAVSLVGIAAAVKGTALVAIPDLTLKSSRPAGTGLKLSAIGFLAAGGYLTYVGYTEAPS